MKNPKNNKKIETLNPKLKVGMTISHVNCERAEIVKTIRDVNSSNFAKVKLVKFLNKFGVIWIVLNTFQTPAVECEKFMGVARNHHAMENSHVFIVHILQYLFITWSRSEMNTIIKRSITLIWRRHLWFQMKMRKEMFGMNSSLNSPHENLSYTL